MLMNILVPDIAVAEKLLRSVAVYGFLLVAFRIAGKRQLGQLTPFDLIVLLIISNVLQNAAIGNDNSLGRSSGRHRHHPVRKEGFATFTEVRYAILEEDGRVTVIPRRATVA
jgi:uncharacterized membrane protein YcaP (DUF421 family)